MPLADAATSDAAYSSVEGGSVPSPWSPLPPSPLMAAQVLQSYMARPAPLSPYFHRTWSAVLGRQKRGNARYLPNAWLTSMADSEAGSLGVPEEDYAVLRHHVRHPDEMPIVVVAFIEGVLNLLHDVGVLVHRNFLGIVSSVVLLCHTIISFRCLVEAPSISSVPNAAPPMAPPPSRPPALFTEVLGSCIL